MSINLGNEAIDAARRMHVASADTQEWFQAMRDAVLEQARKAMNTALECDHAARADAIGYARALRDVYMAFESAATSQKLQQVEKPGMEGRRAAR